MLLNQSSPPLYSLAIMLAAEEQLEPAEIMKLYKVQCGLSVYHEMASTQSQYHGQFLLISASLHPPHPFYFVCQQYGDHLYEEKDFDGSIAQYSHTVGYIPSSSVIT